MDGDAGHCSHEANPEQAVHFRLVRGHLGNALEGAQLRRPTPPISARPRAGDAITTHPRPSPDERHIHDSTEANPGREIQSRLIRDQQ
jgi:hypothetical protein